MRGEKDVLVLVRPYLERRFCPLVAQNKNFAHVGAELDQSKDFAVAETKQKFTDALQYTPASKDLRPEDNVH